MTYASTIILGLLALWQNQRFKEENDKSQERLEKISNRTNELQIISQLIEHENERRIKRIWQLEHYRQDTLHYTEK